MRIYIQRALRLLELGARLGELLDRGVVVGRDLVQVLDGRDDLVEVVAGKKELDEIVAVGLHLVDGAQGLGRGLLLCRELGLDLLDLLLVGVDLVLELGRVLNGGVVRLVARVDPGLELVERGGRGGRRGREGEGQRGCEPGADSDVAVGAFILH